mmetsp:Transcript_148412/g.385869  ORF Transcript_148412/g.385869 Transcript_148412/m.385869 type:complete len:247 (-) Transcript_148412:366-1106(-)
MRPTASPDAPCKSKLTNIVLMSSNFFAVSALFIFSIVCKATPKPAKILCKAGLYNFSTGSQPLRTWNSFSKATMMPRASATLTHDTISCMVGFTSSNFSELKVLFTFAMASASAPIERNNFCKAGLNNASVASPRPRTLNKSSNNPTASSPVKPATTSGRSDWISFSFSRVRVVLTISTAVGFAPKELSFCCTAGTINDSMGSPSSNNSNASSQALRQPSAFPEDASEASTWARGGNCFTFSSVRV